MRYLNSVFLLLPTFFHHRIMNLMLSILHLDSLLQCAQSNNSTRTPADSDTLSRLDFRVPMRFYNSERYYSMKFNIFNNSLVCLYEN